jgi:hypothetical protein
LRSSGFLLMRVVTRGLGAPEAGRDHRAWGVSPRSTPTTDCSETQRGDIGNKTIALCGFKPTGSCCTCGSRRRLYDVAAARLRKMALGAPQACSAQQKEAN